MNDKTKVKDTEQVVDGVLVESDDATNQKKSELPAAPGHHLPVAKVAEINSMSPMEQFVEAKRLGISLDEMKGMLELQKDWEANEARKAFHAALSKWKENPPTILKDLINLKYGSAYSSIGNTVNTCNESMGPHGLNARWDYPETDDINKIKVTCILSHTLGHEEKVSLTGTPDKEGSKNPLQERKSARTYLKLETYEAVTGVASIAGNKDDDGNSAAPAAAPMEVITKDQALTISAKITDNELDKGDGAEKFVEWVAKFFPYTQGNVDKLTPDHYAKVITKLDVIIKMKNDKADSAE